ncbi:hypothetical protein EVAR_61719_1 [Eumeta japonica]|uniref:Uncharacterized protein n=1 Tax=Eumeta variegata TaxID=151549 RepID=A0A4C1ZR42_EUMVA|nr:hypothetical protein EVAR_61719_1 [Eumeta japonica]
MISTFHDNSTYMGTKADVFTKICHKQNWIMRLERRLFPEYHSVDTLTPRRLKRDNPRRGYGLGRQNQRNELIEPTPSTSKSLMMELEGGHRNSVIKQRNPIEFGLVCTSSEQV